MSLRRRSQGVRQKSAASEKKEGKYFRQERIYGHFERASTRRALDNYVFRAFCNLPIQASTTMTTGQNVVLIKSCMLAVIAFRRK